MKRFLGFAVFLLFLASCCILPASAESTSYQVKILYTRNGTVTVDRSAAAPGEQVTVNADVSGDGEADIQDALLILQYVCGWDVTLR